jgi:hypothetical protein
MGEGHHHFFNEVLGRTATEEPPVPPPQSHSNSPPACLSAPPPILARTPKSVTSVHQVNQLDQPQIDHNAPKQSILIDLFISAGYQVAVI